MEPRSLFIPVAAALGLSFSSGCAERVSLASGGSGASGGDGSGDTGEDPTTTGTSPGDGGDPTTTGGDPTTGGDDDLIVGRWNLSRVTFTYPGGQAGYGYDYPRIYDGPGCYYKFGYFMRVEPSFEGEMVEYYEIKCDGEDYGLAYPYALTVMTLDPGQLYRIEFPDYPGDFFECDLEGDDLTCNAIPVDGTLIWEFVRA